MFGPIGRIPQRASAIERVESHDVSDAELERIFDFYDTLGRRWGGNAVVLGFLAKASRRWTGPVSILDMGCGRGDLARAIVGWARSKNLDVRVHGADKYGRIVHLARDRHRGVPELTFDVRGLNDALYLQAQQFDYVVSMNALHREDDAHTVAFLKTADRLARRGVIVMDWVRDARAAFYLSVLARLCRNEAVRDEARLAVGRGFLLKEARRMREEAKMDFASVMPHFGYRFSIAGERALIMDAALNPIAGLAI